ncbi:MAG: hypothetical protein V4451_15980 [Pseudomonadota bacterium]
MFKDSITGALYFGEMRAGDSVATAGEVAAWEAARVPTKAELVAAYYAAKGKDQLLVQTVIDVIEDKAKTLAPTYGMSFEQAKAAFYASNKSYRECRIIKQGQIDIESAP